MLIFLCICAGLTTASLIVLVVFLIRMLTQLRRTAGILESLASNANEKVDTFNGMFDTIRSVSNGMRSGWFKSIQFALGLVSAYRDQRSEQQARDQSAGQRQHASHDSAQGSPCEQGSPSPKAEDTPPKDQAARQHDAGNNTRDEGQSRI